MEDLLGALGAGSPFPFVGRTAELERLRTLVPRAAGEGRRVVLVGGAAGSGKSRLAREFALEAAREGALVLHGACDAVVRTPYGPFVEALDQLARALEPDALRAALGPGGGELARILPDLPARLPGLPPAVSADPDTERHRLHTAIADLLAGVTRERPALLVLEDGHWADAPTLLLLRHLARTASGRVLLLVTFRDTGADVGQGLADTLADLRRYDVVRFALAGLSAGDVADFVRRAGGGAEGPEAQELARALRELTAGNPFLVCELWRSLSDSGAVECGGGALRIRRPPGELASPESVREVAGQRLSRLAPRTIELLELAATAGARFDLDVVRRAAGMGDAELLAALDEAVRSGMLDELPLHGRACRFTHELMRRAVYDGLSGPRRADLHLRVGQALETTADRSRRTLADLAHHFAAAAPFGGAERAVEHNLLAARAAAAALAFDDAAQRFRTALELGIEDPSARSEAYLELGEASHRAGHAVDALTAFAEAAEIARRCDDAQLLARAAIGYEEACWRPSLSDRGAVELLEEADGALGGEDSRLRVGVLGGLARALDFQGRHEPAAAARAGAVAMARRLEDKPGLATVLMRSYWSQGTASLGDVLDMLTEARDLGEELAHVEIRAEAMAWRVPALVAMCDVESARREIATFRATVERTGQPYWLHVADHYGSALALCDGRLAAAETLAVRSSERGRLLTGRGTSGVHGIQMFSVRRELGRLAELAPAIRVLAADPDRDGPWRPGLVALLAELGMHAEARRELARVTADGLEPFRPSLWLAALIYLADAAAALGDTDAAALVYPELAEFGGGNVMIGHLVACYGAADRYLGMLAATLGEADSAEAHFERAMELNRRMGAATWLAHTAFEYGRFLLGRGAAARPRAEGLLGEAAALAERVGMPPLLERIRGLGTPAPAPVLPDGLSPREAQLLGLVAQGLSNREIGSTLTISEHTAANHVRSILRKTRSVNRTEAASYAHRNGLVRGGALPRASARR